VSSDATCDLQVTIDNVEEYAELTESFCLERGIARQMQAFYQGFNQVFPMDKLRAFSPEEVRVMLCGDQNPQWTREDLLNYTEPKLGYTRDRYVPKNRFSWFIQFVISCLHYSFAF